ncbi:MAG: hypothetical protein KKH94_06930, partial [Candidatus Omnitrophica bacterium]|nr:hypothetical protein [Candidatus Omnitrophota bacterium]
HSGEDADARIIAMIQSSHAPQATTVISDDTYIRNHCKVYGAQIKPVSSLIARAPQISGACKKTKSSAHLQSKKISPAAKNSINQFLKKEWGIE